MNNETSKEVKPCTAGLVLGILSVVFFWMSFFCLPMTILAIVFGAIGIKKEQPYSLAALTLGILSGFLMAIMLLVLFSAAA